jgi:hypothetical protein
MNTSCALPVEAVREAYRASTRLVRDHVLPLDEGTLVVGEPVVHDALGQTVGEAAVSKQSRS